MREKGVEEEERGEVRGEEVPLTSGPNMSDGPPGRFYPAQHVTHAKPLGKTRLVSQT